MIFNKKKLKFDILKLFLNINLFHKYVMTFFKFFFLFKSSFYLIFSKHYIKMNFWKSKTKNFSFVFDNELSFNNFNKKQNILNGEVLPNRLKLFEFDICEKDFFLYTRNKKKSYFHFFLTFNFLFSFSSFNYFSKHNHFLHFFFFKNYKKNFLQTNMIKFVNRWKNAQNLLFSVYYYQFNPFIFGSFDYKNEILALNWNNFFFDLKFWKYCSNFFIFKINKYGEKVFFFYNKLLSFDVNFFLISNSLYHYKNLYYFRRLKIFTIGLAASKFNPWLLSYPIPSISLNNNTEYYFLKLLLFFYKNVLFFKYNILKKNWFSFFISLKIKNIFLKP